MLEYQSEDCSSRNVMLASSLFCSCGTPFVDKYRHLIHPNDDVHICTSNGCNKAFLNFQSLRGHASVAHDIEVGSEVEFYTQTGDTAVQFGDVQRILQDPASDSAQDELDEPEEEDINMSTDPATDTKPKRLPNAERSKAAKDTYRNRQQPDDLEELM
ncbi:hypothetical protein, conserved [Babesia bigemina]|uniref:C2H2-type domain-containing protein n=1 Tax=Babesia bigemina TaxID=5866 RepID=A0A061D5R2_BABBI|nr:hypothetical protein, conserved [Babesia bigemina]CDR94279.1 hypothetical protein, conserved [Babesia bigemina]|eukprot:XP_012766465.1 hypothetical protein, conserved [Babesia bigemina]